jgi:shikimate dehydrogenase
MDRYAVFGSPITQSKSPLIHRMFAEQLREELSYDAIEPKKDGFLETISDFFAQGALGANVTAPFKLEALNFAGELSERASLAGAVNTLMLQADGTIFGDNTDGQGLVEDLHRQFGSLNGLGILLLGAGGAARGVIAPLFVAGAKSIRIANRTEEKAQKLAQQFSSLGDVRGYGLGNLPIDGFDLVINSTSSSMTGELPGIQPSALDNVHYVYDMFYQAQATSFMQWVIQYQANVQVSDGLGMLVGQAAESFYVWRGLKPDIAPVIENLRKHL